MSTLQKECWKLLFSYLEFITSLILVIFSRNRNAQGESEICDFDSTEQLLNYLENYFENIVGKEIISKQFDLFNQKAKVFNQLDK